MLAFHFDIFALIFFFFKDDLVIYKCLAPYSFSDLALIVLKHIKFFLSVCFPGLILLLFFLTLAH